MVVWYGVAGWYREASGSAAPLLLRDSLFVRRPWRLLLKFVHPVPVVPGWKDCATRLCQLGEEVRKQEQGSVPAALLPQPGEDVSQTHICCPCWL